MTMWLKIQLIHLGHGESGHSLLSKSLPELEISMDHQILTTNLTQATRKHAHKTDNQNKLPEFTLFLSAVDKITVEGKHET
jgi:hypothetical protein